MPLKRSGQPRKLSVSEGKAARSRRSRSGARAEEARDEADGAIKSDSPSSDQERHQALEAVRQRIDQVDAELSALLSERFLLSLEVAAVKADLNIGVKDPAREQKVLDRVGAASDRQDIAAAIQTVYQNIFACSRKLQYREDAVAVSTAPQDKYSAAAAEGKQLVFPRVTIVGLGLIGGAIAHLIRSRLPNTWIVGSDIEGRNVDKAIELQLIDEGETDLIKAVSQSSLIVLAASPAANLTLLDQIGSALNQSQLVIDVTSVKSVIVQAAASLNLTADFIGGHPLFGSEKSGLDAAAAVTTDGAIFCLTPTGKTAESTIKRLMEWLSLLNLKADVVDAGTHDQVLARTSHAVQFLTIALGAELADLAEQCGVERVSSLAGPSVKQMARLMNSPSDLWCEIASQNQTQIVEALRSLAATLDVLSNAVATDDRSAINTLFERARSIGAAMTQPRA